MSEVEICNHALARVGQPPIININDGDRNSRICKLHYAAKRDDLIRNYRWKFAIKRAELPSNATAPVYGYEYAYRVPNDCLRVLSVNEFDPEFDSDLDPTLWDIEDKSIVTNEGAPISVRYLSQVTNTDAFDPSFSNCLSSYLAYFIVPSLREVESNLSGALLEEFEFFLNKARHINAIEARKRKRRRSRSEWVYGYRGIPR